MELAVGIFFGGVAVAAAVWFVRHAVSVRRGNYRHAAKGSKWFVVGQGTHGSTGGQTPPIVAKSDDWDPRRRIK